MQGFVGRAANRFEGLIRQSDSRGVHLERNEGSCSGIKRIEVDEDYYDQIMSQMNQLEERADEVMNYVLDQMEQLCHNSYQMPNTSKRVIGMVEHIRRQVPQARSLSGEVVNRIGGLIRSISESDI